SVRRGRLDVLAALGAFHRRARRQGGRELQALVARRTDDADFLRVGDVRHAVGRGFSEVNFVARVLVERRVLLGGLVQGRPGCDARVRGRRFLDGSGGGRFPGGLGRGRRLGRHWYRCWFGGRWRAVAWDGGIFRDALVGARLLGDSLVGIR